MTRPSGDEDRHAKRGKQRWVTFDSYQGDQGIELKVVKQILRRQGVSHERELNPGDRITVCASGYMDLIIEKVGTDRISVAHYYTKQGDLMSDPEVVFRIDGEEWIPVRFTQHPNIHQYDEDGLPKIDAFLRTWTQNLKRQGFVDEATRTF